MVREDLISVVKPCCEQQGAHLIDIVLRGNQARPAIDVFVDAEAGVTSDLCSAISRNVTNELDALDSFPSSYTLVVSSPGIDRPLKFMWQYKKHVGRRLVLNVKTVEGRGELGGTLIRVSDDSIEMKTGKGATTVRFSEIESATVKAPW